MEQKVKMMGNLTKRRKSRRFNIQILEYPKTVNKKCGEKEIDGEMTQENSPEIKDKVLMRLTFLSKYVDTNFSTCHIPAQWHPSA